MNTLEIINELKDLKCFKGVFPLDKISNKIFYERPIGIIINLDYSNEKGSHWVAVYLDKNELYYFDSLGIPNFNEHFLRFCKLNKVKKIIFNKSQLQAINSTSCGAFCVLFIKFRCNDLSFDQFLKIFSKDKQQNDLMAQSILD